MVYNSNIFLTHLKKASLAEGAEMIKDITSTKNEVYKYVKSLKTKKVREKNRQFTVEGIKSVGDAISSGADIAYVVISDKLDTEIAADIVYRIPDAIFPPLCDTEAPQGILAVINMPEKQNFEAEEDLYLLCDRVNDPGNMGTLIRICDAVGCGLLLMRETVDMYSPKTVRASMGSFFRVPVRDGLVKEDIVEMKKAGYTVISGALAENTVDYRKIPKDGKRIIVVGNEANGISEEILNLSDFCVKIPIWGGAESLNVAVAGALLLYEARRDRDK